MKFQTVTVVGQSAAHEGREKARTREKGVLFGENKRRHYQRVHTASYPCRSLHHTQQFFSVVTSNYFSSLTGNLELIAAKALLTTVGLTFVVHKQVQRRT